MADEELNPNTIEDLDIDSGDAVPTSEASSAKDEEMKSLNDKYLRLAAEFDIPIGVGRDLLG